MADQPIAMLARQIMDREMAQDPSQFEQPVPNQPAYKPQVMSPGLLHTLGGLADAASTYYFTKRGAGVESNPMVTGLAGTSPEMTGAVVLGGLGVTKTLAHLIGKKYPRVADALAANLGAQQMALSVGNVNRRKRLPTDLPRPNSAEEYQNSMVRHTLNNRSSK